MSKEEIVDLVVHAVSMDFGVPKKEIVSVSRLREVVNARAMVFVVLFDHYHLIIRDIADILNVKRPTAFSLLGIARSRLESDIPYRDSYRRIVSYLKIVDSIGDMSFVLSKSFLAELLGVEPGYIEIVD